MPLFPYYSLGDEKNMIQPHLDSVWKLLIYIQGICSDKNFQLYDILNSLWGYAF